MDYVVVWLALFFILAVSELITMGLTSIWFAVGALAACLVSALGANLIVQAIVFVVVSILILLFIRPFAVNYINKDPEKTNVESMEGKVGEVTADINNVLATGTVKIDGMDWTARTDNGEIIEAGEYVKVLRVEGVKVIVEKTELNN